VERLRRHIPDRDDRRKSLWDEHLVRYVGWYSNRARGERAKAQKTQDAPALGALDHLGLWQPEASERSPPVPPEAWPVNSVLPMTYHPVPDIA